MGLNLFNLSNLYKRRNLGKEYRAVYPITVWDAIFFIWWTCLLANRPQDESSLSKSLLFIARNRARNWAKFQERRKGGGKWRALSSIASSLTFTFHLVYNSYITLPQIYIALDREHASLSFFLFAHSAISDQSGAISAHGSRHRTGNRARVYQRKQLKLI